MIWLLAGAIAYVALMGGLAAFNRVTAPDRHLHRKPKLKGGN